MLAATRFPVRHAAPPTAPPPVAPTDPTGLWRELRAAWQWARLLRRAPHLIGRSDEPRTVVLIPGWQAPQISMSPLRRYLRSRGHDARHWGLGVNRGNPERDVLMLLPQLQRLAHATGRPVSLVGWSLGGVIAREAARERPDVVDRVITYGTPTVGGPTYTLAAEAWGEAECARIADMSAERDLRKPIRVPVTAIFSRRDRVVAWPACLDRANPQVDHVEVGSSHVGLGLDPDVWTVVVEALERGGSAPKTASEGPTRVQDR